MHGCGYGNAFFGGLAARKPQHLGAVGLHGKVAQGPRVGIAADADGPAEHRRQLARKHGLIKQGIRPGPERVVGAAVQPQQLARHNRRLADALRQAVGTHGVLHTEHAVLELLALLLVAGLGRIGGHGAGRLGESQIRVAG